MRLMRKKQTRADQPNMAGRSAAAAVAAYPLRVKILRMVLVFAVAFCGTLRLQYGIAYADDKPEEDGSIVKLKLEAPDGYNVSEKGGSLQFKVIATWVERDDEGNVIEEHKDYNASKMMDWSVSDGSMGSISEKGKFTAAGDTDGTVEISVKINKKYKKLLDSGEFSDGYKETFDVSLSGQAPPEEPEDPEGGDGGEGENGEGGGGTGGGNGGEGDGGNTPVGESYAYVMSIEILQSDGSSFPAGARQLNLPAQDASYSFAAKAVVVPDSNNPGSVQEYLCTPDNGLAAQTNGALPDLTWEVSASSAKGGEGSASIDSATGALSISAGMQGTVTCWSAAGQKLTSEGASYLSDEVAVSTAGDQDDKPAASGFSLSYDPNGGTGEMNATIADESGAAVAASSSFMAPEGQEFKSWNTLADGSGESYAPGASVLLTEDTTLFAQWGEVEHEEQDPGDLSLPDDGKLHVVISYTPTPKGQTATLSPVVSGTGDAMFGYMWEVSHDDGETWEYIESTSVQALMVATTDENIGNQYRVTVVTDKQVEEGDESNEAVSPAVTLKAAEDSFSIILSYEPVEYGKTAVLSVTSTEKSASYEWLVSSNGGAEWKTIGGATGMTYAVSTVEGNLGNWYRVKATAARTSQTPSAEGSGDASATPADGAESEGAATPEPQPAAGSTTKTITIYSNIQMLVARVPDAEVVPATNPDDPMNPEGQDGDQNTPSEDPGAADAGDESGDADGGETLSEQADRKGFAHFAYQDGRKATMTPIDNIAMADGNQSQDASRNTVLIDEEVSKKIADEGAVSKEEQVAQQPGARWRALNIIPQPEEIQQVLAENPFAPFIIPLAVAVAACGAVEKLLAYRRQKMPSVVRFAS